MCRRSGTNTTPHKLITKLPCIMARNKSIKKIVEVTFSESMAAETINGTNIKLRNTATSAEVSGVVSFNSGTNTARFTPSGPLLNSTGYTVVVATGVRDQAGNALAGQYSASFTTAAASGGTAPTVVSTSPANGTTEVTPGATVKVTFSKAMDPATINGSTFGLVVKASNAAVAGAVSYDAATHAATFTPSAPLANDTEY